MESIIEKLLKEEEQLQFPVFNEDVAWQLGNMLVEAAIKNHFPITIDISMGDRQLFHASRPGASADNDEWIKRKSRVVKRFGHSSFYIGQLLEQKKKTIGEKYFVSDQDYSAYGGSFPAIVKGSGVIGTITVSGLAQDEDHKFVVEMIEEYLRTIF